MRKFIVRGDLSKDPALTVENQLLLSPGTYRGHTLTPDAIKTGIKNTDWSDKKARAIIFGHRSYTDAGMAGQPSPDDWAGFHSEPRYLTLSDGVPVEGMYADLFFFDDTLAKKIAFGGVRCGMSEGMELGRYPGVINKFTHAGIVERPADKNAFLNLSEKDEMIDTVEPSFLNLSEDNTTKVERGSDIMNTEEEKIKELEAKVANLEKEKTEAEAKKAAEAEAQAKAREAEEAKKAKAEAETAKAAAEAKAKEEAEAKAAEAAKAEAVKSEPTVIEKPADNTAVVDAINKMSTKLETQLKTAAESATTAGTNPNAALISSEDETTNDLVERYKTLHQIDNE